MSSVPLNDDSQEKSPQKPKPFALPLVIAATLTAIGMLGGAIIASYVYQITPKFFESRAVLHISPRSEFQTTGEPSAESQISHGLAIRDSDLIRENLSANQLFDLASLANLETREAVRRVRSHLNVEVNPEEKSVIVVSYRSLDPDDAKTILSNHVEIYRTFLRNQYDSSELDTILNVLQETKKKFENDFQSITYRIEKLKSEIANNSTGNNSLEHLQVLEKEQRQTQEFLEATQQKEQKLIEQSIDRNPSGFQFKVLENAARGESTTNFGTTMLAGTLFGFAAGAILGLMIGFTIWLIG